MSFFIYLFLAISDIYAYCCALPKFVGRFTKRPEQSHNENAFDKEYFLGLVMPRNTESAKAFWPRNRQFPDWATECCKTSCACAYPSDKLGAKEKENVRTSERDTTRLSAWADEAPQKPILFRSSHQLRRPPCKRYSGDMCQMW